MAITSASGPSLKPLVKSVLGSSSFQKSSYYLHGSHDRGKDLSQSDGRHRIYGGSGGHSGTDGGAGIPLGNYKGQITSTATHGSANTSQENIIGNAQGGILRTTDVKVDVEIGVRPKNDSEDSLRRLEFGV